MDLQLALKPLHVADCVRLVIHALSDRLTNMEELLQAALVLVLIYALLESILLQARQLAQHVMLVIHALPARLISSEELLQAVLVLLI